MQLNCAPLLVDYFFSTFFPLISIITSSFLKRKIIKETRPVIHPIVPTIQISANKKGWIEKIQVTTIQTTQAIHEKNESFPQFNFVN